MRARDTSAQSDAVQMEIYRRLGPSARVRLAARMSAETRDLTRAGIRARHPEYSGDEIEQALRRILFGDDLYRRVWPGRPLLEP